MICDLEEGEKMVTEGGVMTATCGIDMKAVPGVLRHYLAGAKP